MNMHFRITPLTFLRKYTDMSIHCSLFQKEYLRHCEVGQALQKGQNQHKGHMMCAQGGLLSWVVAICCSCSLLPDTPSLASKPSINFFHGTQISSERERDRGSTHGNSTHKLILSPVLSQRRSQLEPSSSSSPPHRFTTTSPCWSSGCSRSRSCRPAVPEQSEWVSACRWRWQCARHLASSPPSRHCSRLLVVHH